MILEYSLKAFCQGTSDVNKYHTGFSLTCILAVFTLRTLFGTLKNEGKGSRVIIIFLNTLYSFEISAVASINETDI